VKSALARAPLILANRQTDCNISIAVRITIHQSFKTSMMLDRQMLNRLGAARPDHVACPRICHVFGWRTSDNRQIDRGNHAFELGRLLIGLH
jgi:hypothetical protein